MMNQLFDIKLIRNTLGFAFVGGLTYSMSLFFETPESLLSLERTYLYLQSDSDIVLYLSDLKRILNIENDSEPNKNFEKLCDWLNVISGYSKLADLYKLPLDINYTIKNIIRTTNKIMSKIERYKSKIPEITLHIADLILKLKKCISDIEHNIHQALQIQLHQNF